MTDWKLVHTILEHPQIRTAYLWGPPGIGKTYTAYTHGRLDRGLFAVTLTEETPAAELRGHFVPRGGELVWMDGPVVEAMRRGARLVLNEVTHASADAWSFLLPILEGFGTARLTLPNCETVSPAEGFHVICTDNCSPQDLPAALRDRFDSQMHIVDPHPSALALLSEDLRQTALTCVKLEESRAISLRGWLAVTKLEPSMGRERAMDAVFGAPRAKQLREAMVPS